MITPKFFGKIEKGRFNFNTIDQKFYNEYISKFKDKQEMELIVKKKYKKRTTGKGDEDTNFNGYYWGIIIEMVAEEIGEIDKEAVHKWIQTKINSKMMPNGDIVSGETKQMTGGEFSEMCGRARIWAGTPMNVCVMGMNIPEPNECEYPNY